MQQPRGSQRVGARDRAPGAVQQRGVSGISPGNELLAYEGAAEQRESRQRVNQAHKGAQLTKSVLT